VVEIVAVEFVDAHADRAGGDERIEVEFVLVEESDGLGDRLVREVAADYSLIGDGIVGLADARQQQELNVEDAEGREDDVSTKVTPVARLPEGSTLMRVTSHSVR